MITPNFDPRKVFDLLQAALNHLRGQLPGLEMVVFGQLATEVAVDVGFPIHYTGHLHDDVSLRLLYSTADVMLAPSRQEAFGQTASEAHACDTTVVAFNATGLLNVVAHEQTGYLANAFDPVDLTAGMAWVLANAARLALLGTAAHASAVELLSGAVVAPQYLQVYGNELNKVQI